MGFLCTSRFPKSTMPCPVQYLLYWLLCLLLLSSGHASPLSEDVLHQPAKNRNLTKHSVPFSRTAPKQANDMEIFRVPHSHTTLGFYGFGLYIPDIKALRFFTRATINVTSIISESGGEEIPFGQYSYTLDFADKDVISLVVSDFREIGKPLTFLRLNEVVRGIPQFLIPQQWYRELNLEVVVDGSGHVASGHVEYRPGTPSLSMTGESPRETRAVSSDVRLFNLGRLPSKAKEETA